jgi:hypothetical protein
VIKRNIALVFSTNALILATSVVTSLLGAWALGPEGRGEVALVTLWPHLFMYFASLGLPHAMRYWAARRTDWTGALISQSILYAMVAGTVALIGAEVFVPFWVGPRHATLIWMIRLFLFNVPLILLFELLRGVLEGARQFGWLGAARFAFFGVQGIGYASLFLTGRLTVKTAVLTIAMAQLACTALALIAVLRELRPVWGTSREVFRETLRYGLRSYPGQLTENSMLRLDQVMLASLASSAFIGLYAVAVALAEITVTLGSAVSDAMLPEPSVIPRVAFFRRGAIVGNCSGLLVSALFAGFSLRPGVCRRNRCFKGAARSISHPEFGQPLDKRFERTRTSRFKRLVAHRGNLDHSYHDAFVFALGFGRCGSRHSIRLLCSVGRRVAVPLPSETLGSHAGK